MRRRVEGLLWPVAAGLGAVLPLAFVLVSGRTLVWRDTAQLYAPHRGSVVEAIRSLRVPAWNPWEGTGQPLFAQGLHSVLHPISLAVALLTSSTDALIVALVAFAAIGTWLAGRALGLSSAAAAGTAFACAMSGYALGMSANVTFLVGFASGPWVIAGMVEAGRRPAGWLAAAAAIAALAFSGDAGALVAFTLAGAALTWASGGWPALLRAGLGAALGVALAAVQLLPSWVYLAETTRGTGLLDPGAAHRWALAPWRLVELVAPGLFVGIPRSYTAPVYSILGGGGPDRFPFAPSVFVGAPVIVLAFHGARRSTLGRWLAGLSVLFLWLALGHHAGSQQLLADVPVWGVLRYWEKMVGPFTVCAALATGFGIESLSSSSPLIERTTLGAALVCLAGLALLPLMPDGDPIAATLARSHLLLGLGHAATGLAALWAVLVVGRARPRLLPGAIVAVLYIQSATAAPFALHAGARAVLAARPPALAADAPGPRLVAPLGFDFAEGQAGLDAIDLLQFWEGRSGRPSTNVRARVDSLASYSGFSSTRWEMILGSGELFWPLARRFSTTHVIARAPTSAPEGDALQAATAGTAGFRSLDGGALLVWELPHRPWASFAPSARAAPSLEVAGAFLGEEMLADRPTVVVECASLPATSSGRVLTVTRGVDEISIEAESGNDALLVVNDAWARGWTATIDGAATEILPADVLVRAVRWPAGRHRLVMRYHAPGLTAGAGVSTLALIVAAAILAWQRTARRRERLAPAPVTGLEISAHADRKVRTPRSAETIHERTVSTSASSRELKKPRP